MRQRRWRFFQELAYLRFTPPDTRQALDLALRFFDAGRGIQAEVFFQRSGVLDQFALGSVEMNLFQSFDAALPIQLKILAHGRFRDIAQGCDLGMGQAMTLQPQDFHSALHQRNWMMKTFIIQRLNDFGGKFELERHAIQHTHSRFFVNRKPRFLPALSIYRATDVAVFPQPDR